MKKKVVGLLVVALFAFIAVLVSCNKEPEVNSKVGTLGPAGGYIFYDCDADNDSGNADNLISSECGWRYLEAAPENVGAYYESGELLGYRDYIFGYYRGYSIGSNKTVGTETRIGKGKANTEALVKVMGETAYADSSRDDKDTYAAKACVDYSVTKDGITYNDWFLPSRDELNLMYVNLHKNGMGSFVPSFDVEYDEEYYGPFGYWSSSESSDESAWLQYFDDRSSHYGSCRNGRGETYYVRPIRAFK